MRLILNTYKVYKQTVWLLFVMVCSVWSEWDWIDLIGDEPVRRSLNAGEIPPEPVVEVNAFDMEGNPVAEGNVEDIYKFIININIPGFRIEDIEKEGETYSKISIAGFPNQAEQIGKPSIPYKFFPLMIPYLNEPAAHITHINELFLENLNLFPTQFPLYDVPYDTSFQKDNSAYNSDLLFPESNKLDVSVAKMRNHRILEVFIAPLLVNTLRKQGYIARSIEMEIILEHSDLPENREEEGLSSYAFDKLLSPNLRETREEYDLERYLIITHENFINDSKLEEFINWKKRKGNHVDVITNRTIDPSQGKPTQNEIIYLMQHIEEYGLEYPTYLLIIADHDIDNGIVGAMYDADDPYDLPYSLRDDMDELSDLFYGRVPAGSIAEMRTMLEKIILMDKNPPSSFSDYGYNKVITACMTQIPRVYLETIDAIACYFENDAYGIDYEDVERAWVNIAGLDETSPWPNINDKQSLLWVNAHDQEIGERVCRNFISNASAVNLISNKINEGSSILVHRDHGSPLGFQWPSFQIPQIEALHNNMDKLPLIFSLNCSTGQYHLGFYKNFARRWLNLSTEKGGAYSVIAPTELTSTWANERLAHGLFGGFLCNRSNPIENWFTWFNDDPVNIGWTSNLVLHRGDDYYLGLEPGSATKLGQDLHFGKMWTLQNVIDADFPVSLFRNINNLYHVLGDPEAEVVFHPPVDLDVSYPELVKAGETITVSTGGNENGLQVCLYSEEIFGDDRGLLQITTNGEAEFTLDGIEPYDYGNIKVTITGFGVRPYLGEMTLVPCDLYIKNKTLDKTEEFLAWNNIFAGPNVKIITPADVTFIAGKKIELKPGFEAEASSEFCAFIDELLYDPECE